MLVAAHGPNTLTQHFIEAETTWNVIATDMTGHATLAALDAAGKTRWPGLDAGVELGQVLSLRSENGSGADGSPFYYAINRGTGFSGLADDATRDLNATLASGGGQTRDIPGPIYNVWVRKTVAADEVILNLSY